MQKIVFIALFAVLTLPQVAGAWPNMSRSEADASLLYSTAQSVDDYRDQKGRLPASLNELIAANFHVNKDLAGNLPRYAPSSDGKHFELSVPGPDGRFDTQDDIRYDPAKLADNTLAMFGGTGVVKTALQMQSDEEFIQRSTLLSGTREKACPEVLKLGWAALQQNDTVTAMKRFNQAWLLDPANPDVYKGFAAALRKQGKNVEADRIEGLARK